MNVKTNDNDLFSKLAPEILGHIFVHCLPALSEPISLKSAPLLLVRVCHRWRVVAFDTPSLWQNIQLERRWSENPIFILDFFMAKSGNLPLAITLPFYDIDTPERTEVVVNRVLDGFHRVLSLKGNPSRLFSYYIFKRQSTAGAARHIHAPILKRLNITGFSRPAELSEKMARKYVYDSILAPNLEELNLGHGDSGFTYSMIRFSPQSLKLLTGLNINEMAARRNLSFLREAINLITLSFHVSSAPVNTVLDFPSSVYLPNLKYLDMDFSDTQFAEEIIRSLGCPAIEKLGYHLRSSIPLPNAVELLTKGRTPPLRSLFLTMFPGSPLSSYHRFKDVEEFRLRCAYLEETVIQSFTKKEGHEFQLFPRMSSFTLQKIDVPANQTDSFLAILRTRCTTSGGTLTYVQLQNCKFSADGEEQVRALQKELGSVLKIDIVTFLH